MRCIQPCKEKEKHCVEILRYRNLTIAVSEVQETVVTHSFKRRLLIRTTQRSLYSYKFTRFKENIFISVWIWNDSLDNHEICFAKAYLYKGLLLKHFGNAHSRFFSSKDSWATQNEFYSEIFYFFQKKHFFFITIW
jgi:hypothetical protein